MPAISAITDLVSTDEVRALLGVARKELPDTVISLGVYLNSLKISAGRVRADAWATYVALPSSGLTTDQTAFSEAFKNWSAWQTAKTIGLSLPQFSPRTITDGKAMQQRQLEAPTNVLEALDEMLGQAIEQLLSSLDALVPATASTAAPRIFSRASFGTDPVTG